MPHARQWRHPVDQHPLTTVGNGFRTNTTAGNVATVAFPRAEVAPTHSHKTRTSPQNPLRLRVPPGRSLTTSQSQAQ